MKDHVQKLKELDACRDGLAFANKLDTLQEVWDTCARGDWLLWLLGKTATEADRKNLVLIAAECARLALPYTKDSRVIACIETAEKWARGEATIEQVRTARRAAGDAATAAYDISAYADATASYAAYGAAAAYGAGASADAYAAGASAAAGAAAGADARAKTSKQCADIVRKYYPQAPVL